MSCSIIRREEHFCLCYSVCFGVTGPDGIMRRHCRQCGRAARRRRQRQESSILSGMSCCFLDVTAHEGHPRGFSITCPSLCVSLVSLCHQLQYVRLMKFLHQRGFTSSLLQPALCTGTTGVLLCFTSPQVFYVCLLIKHQLLKNWILQFKKVLKSSI